MSEAPWHVAIRTSGGKQIGFGHVRRCLTLAEAIRRLGGEVVFFLDGDEAMVRLVTSSAFDAIRVVDLHDAVELSHLIVDTPDCRVVVDSYDLGTDYFRALRTSGHRVVAIDDLADRVLPVDLVINGSAGTERLVYRGSPDTHYLIGPRFMLLRPPFALPFRREIRDSVQRILITVGGADPTDLAWRLARQTLDVVPAAMIDVVIGPLFERTTPPAELSAVADGRLAMHRNPPDMRALMLTADLAISGGGQTTYELAATGTPTIGLRLADNQIINLEGLSAAGTLIDGGDPRTVGYECSFAEALACLTTDRARRSAMSVRGRRLVDGRGAERVARAIHSLDDGISAKSSSGRSRSPATSAGHTEQAALP